MRCACIDIGSNTTRLLVADRATPANGSDPRLEPVDADRAFTRIGASLDHDGRIPGEKLGEVVETVAGQVRRARALGAETIHCVATAAVREARNGGELIDLLERCVAGLRVQVLTGEDEARYAFIGAAGTLEIPVSGTLGVADVGGGSSELAVGEPPDRIGWWTSLPIGSSALTRLAELSDPPTAAELDRARRHAAELLGRARPPAAETVLAVGGSATSLSVLVGEMLDFDACQHALDRLLSAPATELAPGLGLDSDRVRLLPAGLVILAAIADRFGVPLRIGHGGLREGVLLDTEA